MAQIHGRINERLKDLDSLNATACEGLVEDLREISEILLWGEQNYHQELFDYFCEKDMLSSFVEVLSMATVAVAVKIQLLQTMSLLTQNLRTRTSLIYVFSNDHINNLISAPCQWSSDEELLSYYITFVKGLALRLDREMLTLFFHSDHFVLYTVPIRLYNSADAMVRTSVRTLTLAVYQVADRPCMEFLVDNSGGYFSLLSKDLREQWQKLGDLSVSKRKAQTIVDDVVDVLLYIADIFTVDNPYISPLLDLLSTKLSMYALEPLLSPSSRSPHEYCSKALAKFIILQMGHYVDVGVMCEKVKEFRKTVFNGIKEEEESLLVLDAAMVLDYPELSLNVPHLAEVCLELIKGGYGAQWHLITIQVLLAVYKMVVREEPGCVADEDIWKCFRSVAEEARRAVFDGPRGMLYRETIAAAVEEIGEKESTENDSSSLVSTIASTPPGRPALLPGPCPVQSPGKYTVDYISLLRRELLPRVRAPPQEDASRELAGLTEGNTIDLGQTDRLSCSYIPLGSDVTIPSQAQLKTAEALYLILWDATFVLAAPERTCPGYGIVRLAAPMATTEASIDREKPCQLKVKLDRSFNLVLVFSDESRCSVAYKHLESRREECLEKEYRQLVDRLLLTDHCDDDDRIRGV